jgi:hypothetical protein
MMNGLKRSSKGLGFLLIASMTIGLTAIAHGDDARVVPGQAPEPPAAPEYDDWFTDAAMRVDLFHTGVATESVYSLDEIVWEPVWPGTRKYLIDPFDYGTYRFRILDASSSREIFRMGYATLFEEWVGTEEAVNQIRRSMSESVRFPWPKKKVTLTIDKRQRDGKFLPVYSLAIDPDSHQISRVRRYSQFEVVDLVDGPEPSRALDVVIVPEGYGREDEDKLRGDLARFAEAFASSEPYRSNRSRLHVRGIMAFSRESGVTEPRKGVFLDTLLGATFNTFDSPRYLTLMHTKIMREVASLAPYDNVFVMVNSARYGGGGVYNQWAVFTSDNEYDDYVMMHEFGHHMGGLGDEYYDSQMTMDEDALYPPGTEPWEPNISAFLGKDRKSIKWNDLISPDVPIPTPETQEHATKIGLFEGAGYKAKDLYRAQADCKMFHKGLIPFCAVCMRSLEAMMRYYTGEELKP